MRGGCRGSLRCCPRTHSFHHTTLPTNTFALVRRSCVCIYMQGEVYNLTLQHMSHTHINHHTSIYNNYDNGDAVDVACERGGRVRLSHSTMDDPSAAVSGWLTGIAMLWAGGGGSSAVVVVADDRRRQRRRNSNAGAASSSLRRHTACCAAAASSRRRRGCRAGRVHNNAARRATTM